LACLARWNLGTDLNEFVFRYNRRFYRISLEDSLSSAEAFKPTLRVGDRRVLRQAKKALTAIDRLNACANADLRGRIQFYRIGFFGFFFGAGCSGGGRRH
jgi:hypothetical protein